MFLEKLENFLTKKKVFFILFLICLGIFTAKNIDVAIMLFVSIIFACALNPAVDKLSNKMNRGLATLITMSIFFGAMLVFILPVVCLSIYEIGLFATEFPQHIYTIDNIIKGMPFLKFIGITTSSLTSMFATSSTNVFADILSLTEKLSSLVLYMFTSIVLLFFFLVDKIKVKKALVSVFPIEYREKASELIHSVCEKLSGYVFAQTVVSGSVWLTMTIGLAICHIPYAVLLGLMAGVLSIIPVVGSAISLIICLIASCDLGIKTLVLIALIFTISHFIENHVVRPYVYSKFLNLHQAIIFLALFIGAKYQGVLGVILAPPFAMALYILFQELYIKKMNEE